MAAKEPAQEETAHLGEEKNSLHEESDVQMEVQPSLPGVGDENTDAEQKPELNEEKVDATVSSTDKNLAPIEIKTAIQENPKSNEHENEDEDLEEGELKDDDDDDDDDDEDEAKRPESSCSSSSSSPSVASSSSSPPLSGSSESKEHSSPKRSSREGSHQDTAKPQLSIIHIQQDGGYRTNRNRDKHDASDKAAKLISMRTALLEARSREIEMKFQKNKSKLSAPPTTQQPLTLLTKTPPANLKMTLAKPSISYCENPNPPKSPQTPDERELDEPKPKKPKKEPKVKKSKKKSKKKKRKPSIKKRKKRSSDSSSSKSVSSDSRSCEPLDLDVAFDTNLTHKGPRTPPDNNVTTLNDEQIEWPSHLIKMTITQPSISYSVNPNSVPGGGNLKRRQSTASSPNERHLIDDDYDWYFDYFLKTYECDRNQAHHEALKLIITGGTYETETLDRWLRQRGYVREEQNDVTDSSHSLDTDENILQEASEGSSIPIVVTRLSRNQVNRDVDESSTCTNDSSLTLRPIQPKFTVLKLQKSVTLPNGQVLPPGTIQKIVHPYPKPDSETLFSHYDLY